MKEWNHIPTTKEEVRACEIDFFDRLFSVADRIAVQKDLRICALTGPTCSGKTTAATMLTGRIDTYGRRTHVISIDDFYYDAAYLRKRSEEKGLATFDYDSVDTIDLDGLQCLTEEIFTSSEVHIPMFDFRNGCRKGYRTLQIDESDLFLFEGIQAAYPEVTKLFSLHTWRGIYIAPLRSIRIGSSCFSPNEIRLLRRLVRDVHFRKTSPELTFAMWNGVRKNEEEHIFPYLGQFEEKVDSTMPYEIGVLKPFLETILGGIAQNAPCYEQARSILHAVASVNPIPSSWIEEDSLYQEFI